MPYLQRFADDGCRRSATAARSARDTRMADTAPALPRNFLRACVLLLLREGPAHGYDLLERAQAFGFNRSDPGGLYRTLRGLEEEGLVHSVWETSSQGPDRRIYEITRAGGESLPTPRNVSMRRRSPAPATLTRPTSPVAAGRSCAPRR